jgi:uncharacterized protein
MSSLPTAAPVAPSLALPNRPWLRVFELGSLFLGLPLVVRWHLIDAPRLLVLGLVTAGAMAVLLADPTFDRSRLTSLGRIRGTLPTIAVRGLLVAVAILGFAWILGSRSIPGAEAGTATWLFGLVLYPAISAWPQELLYRVFFFHRYAGLFSGRLGLIAANALAFGALHLVYSNPVAPLLSVGAGALLASTYSRTRTLGPVWIEHSLYGLSVFALGLGGYFFDGNP